MVSKWLLHDKFEIVFFSKIVYEQCHYYEEAICKVLHKIYNCFQDIGQMDGPKNLFMVDTDPPQTVFFWHYPFNETDLEN